MGIRFQPELCPDCQAPFRVVYTEFRSAPKNPRRWFWGFGVFLATAAMLAAAVTGTYHLLGWLGDQFDPTLRGREFGAAYFILLVVEMLVVWSVVLRLVRRIDRLPRDLEKECENCHREVKGRAFPAGDPRRDRPPASLE